MYLFIRYLFTYMLLSQLCAHLRAFQVVLVVKNPPANSGDIKDVGLIPGSGRYPGGEHGNPLQYSGLENTIYRGDWQATVHTVTKSWTQLKRLHTHTHTHAHLKD